MHGGWEAVIGALRAIDVVVGVYGGFAAPAFAGQFVGASGDHFIGVHVALCAAAGLPDRQRELIIVLSLKDFIGGLFDQAGDVSGQIAIAIIDPCCSLFDERKRV